MAQLLDSFREYTKDHEKLKNVDMWVFIQLFKVFVEFINTQGYEICYRGKKNVRKQIPKS